MLSRIREILSSYEIFESLKIILMRIERLSNLKKLKKNNLTVNFRHEGNVKIFLPKISVWDIILRKKWPIIKKNSDFITRPKSEVLLRRSIYEMYQTGYISPKKSIIDIGCWISDNSIIWSKYLSENGTVFSIDPSSSNLAYGKVIAKLNKSNNIKFIEAVCAEKAGIKLNFSGSLEHTSFKESGKGKFLISTTIDAIITKEKKEIGLLHVDVEGLELLVLKGSEKIILRDNPVISFEQHISKENLHSIDEYLRSLNYKIFMVNEVLQDCALDCRNFFAFPIKKGLPNLTEFKQADGRDLGIFSAVIGKALIEI